MPFRIFLYKKNARTVAFSHFSVYINKVHVINTEKYNTGKKPKN